MKGKSIKRVWCVSLIMIAVCTIIRSVSSLMGSSQPDFIVRLLGVLTIIALPVFVYCTVKMSKERKG